MSTYTAIEYARTGGGLTSDIFCPACMATHGLDPIYDGNARRPATEKDALDEDGRVFIPCAGCGKDEVLCEFEVRGFCDHCGEYHWNARPSRRDEEADDWRRDADREERRQEELRK